MTCWVVRAPECCVHCWNVHARRKLTINISHLQWSLINYKFQLILRDYCKIIAFIMMFEWIQWGPINGFDKQLFLMESIVSNSAEMHVFSWKQLKYNINHQCMDSEWLLWWKLKLFLRITWIPITHE